MFREPLLVREGLSRFKRALPRFYIEGLLYLWEDFLL